MRTILDEEVLLSSKRALAKLGKVGTISRKLQAVISAYKHGIKKTCEIMEISRASLYLWVKEIKNGQIEKLANQAKHKDGIKVKKDHKEMIKSWLSKEPNITITEVQNRLKEKYGLEVSRSTAHRAMKSSGFSYITGRKQHYKQNQQLVDNFKK